MAEGQTKFWLVANQLQGNGPSQITFFYDLHIDNFDSLQDAVLSFNIKFLSSSTQTHQTFGIMEQKRM